MDNKQSLNQLLDGASLVHWNRAHDAVFFCRPEPKCSWVADEFDRLGFEAASFLPKVEELLTHQRVPELVEDRCSDAVEAGCVIVRIRLLTGDERDLITFGPNADVPGSTAHHVGYVFVSRTAWKRACPEGLPFREDEVLKYLQSRFEQALWATTGNRWSRGYYAENGRIVEEGLHLSANDAYCELREKHPACRFTPWSFIERNGVFTLSPAWEKRAERRTRDDRAFELLLNGDAED